MPYPGNISDKELSAIYKDAYKDISKQFVDLWKSENGYVQYKGEWVTKDHVWYDQILEIEDDSSSINDD